MFKKIKDIVIYGDGRYYSAFPAVQSMPGGRIIAAFRRAPNYYTMPGWDEAHLFHGDALSQLMAVTSDDMGETWSNPRLICSPPDGCSQDAGFFYDGEKYLYVNSFIWKYLPDMVGEELKKTGRDEYLLRELIYMVPGGSYVMRSADMGKTWEGPFCPEPLPQNIDVLPDMKLTIHNRGNIVEAVDGYLLLAGQALWFRPEYHSSIVLYRSADQGQTWQYFTTPANDHGVSILEEPRLHITPKGKLVVLIRCHNLNGESFPRARMCIVESTDNGVTWTPPKVLKFHAEPATSFRMADGRVLVAYGYREEPYGTRLRICDPELTDLSTAEEITIRDDGGRPDTGYPWITQIGERRFLLVYYINKVEYHGGSKIEGTIFEIN
jgi:hypothetical protein